MLTRLLDALRGQSDDRPPGADGVAAAPVPPPGARIGLATTTGGGAPRDPILPHPAVMCERWRQEVARAAVGLRERYQADADPRTRGHAERLLLTLAFDHDMVVRQPAPAAREALTVAGDPDCELPRLVQVIERDPTLTRGLMRHASSAMFAAAGAPASIDDAVRRLGGKGVQIAVLAGMAEGLLARGSGAYSARADAMWAAMVRVGPLARTLARALAVPAHEAFLLGLLYDVGALVLFDVLGALRAAAGRGADLSDDFVADALRDLHEPLGGLTLLSWGVDPRAAWAVAHHHRRVPPAEPDRRSELIFLADRFDAALAAGEAPQPEHWCAEGQITVPPERVAAAIARASTTAPLAH
ncbi:hypothetical protein tb265_10460 [Gemmatimonadetes bacterium T265]|nr:hypothetical protein tb265_10460 [Gemmatimonadetes bacterium T265]